MEYLFLAASVLMTAAKSLMTKSLSRFTSRLGAFGLVNTFISAAALMCIIIFTLIRGEDSASIKTALLGLAFAVFTFTAQLCYMRAMAGGKVSSVAFFYSCGFLIPTIAGFFIWQERLSVIGIMGIILLIPALWLCGSNGSDNQAKNSSWIIWALFATLSSGMLGLIQKFHQTSEVKDELGAFLVISMSATMLISFVIALGGRTLRSDSGELGRRGISLSLLCGLIVGAENIINLMLTGIIPAVIFFPVFNGGVIVMSAAAAWVFRGEKLSLRTMLGILCGIVGILLVALK